MEFTVTFDEARDTIRIYYPQINTGEKLYGYIEEIDIQRKFVDCVEIFFTGFESNLLYRDLRSGGAESIRISTSGTLIH